MWAIIVVMPEAQHDFAIDRSAASLPYTVMMCTLAFSTIALGRVTDRRGIVLPLVLSGLSLGLGFIVAGYAPNLAIFSAAHVLIGLGAGTGFGPMMADISHWFVRRRGLAVVVVASGNYLAGTIWPLVMSFTMPVIGWRGTYAGIGVVIAATVLPLALAMRRRPPDAAYAGAEAATAAARADVGITPRALLVLLVLAGFSCCVAMSMPQVHLVAYCGDLGYGVAHGAEMLSLMMALGIVSRIGSGFVADAIGGSATLMIGSFMQGVALALYLYFDGLTSLFVVSGIFGLFQGGIVPMYAVICRELLPPSAGGRDDRPRRLGDHLRHGVRRLLLRGDFRPDQLVPDGVPQRAPVQPVQFRHRRLALLAPAAASAGARADRRLNLGFLGDGPFRGEGAARDGRIILDFLGFARAIRDFSMGCAEFQWETIIFEAHRLSFPRKRESKVTLEP